jgi:hypothetical protein
MNSQPTLQNQSTTYFFNTRELARLAVYRAAVVARFYTDQCAPTRIRPEIDVIRLFGAVQSEQQQAA